MESLSYEAIAPLVCESEQDGTYWRCTFRCPVSETKVESRAPLQHGSTQSAAVDRAKASFGRSLKWRLASMIGSAMGGGIAGQLGFDVARGALGGEGSPSFSKEDKERATVEAFRNVQSRFCWDSPAGRWIVAEAAGDLLSGFAQQINKAPLATPYDRGIAARMLYAVAAADGTVGEDERQFLGSFLPKELGSIDAVATRPPLSAAELQECSQGAVRETMLMLTWGLALTDGDLDTAEQARLDQFAAELGISGARAGELKSYAQQHVLDAALEQAYPRGQRDATLHHEAMRLAAQIGLDAVSAERVDIRFRKRNGIV